MIVAYFSLSGNNPEERISFPLNLYGIGEMKKGTLIFRTFMWISSYPVERLFFRDLIILSIP